MTADAVVAVTFGRMGWLVCIGSPHLAARSSVSGKNGGLWRAPRTARPGGGGTGS